MHLLVWQVLARYCSCLLFIYTNDQAHRAFWQYRFDLAKFYKEAHRTLKAGGVLAVWGATLPMVEGNSSATQLIIDFAHKKEYLGDCWDERASIVHTEYKDVHPDQTLFKEEQRVSVTTVAESSFASLVSNLILDIILNTHVVQASVESVPPSAWMLVRYHPSPAKVHERSCQYIDSFEQEAGSENSLQISGV